MHVSHSRYEVPTYLQTLAVNVLERHDVPKGYLDTLSTAKFSTWNVYQHRLDEVNPASEVDGKLWDQENAVLVSRRIIVHSFTSYNQSSFPYPISIVFNRTKARSFQPARFNANGTIHVPYIEPRPEIGH